ncbi:MAG: Molybdopterin dehydrogenase [Modestobacter sp.]|nr:Molybdopterin dehydrogenase [Modestobacter sp.]
MKPAPFDYVQVTSVAEALDALAADPDQSKLLAGGQSLVPMMNFRLARPAVLIDINRADELNGVARDGGRLRIGATTRHLQLQNLGGDDALSSLLRRAAVHIGHLPIRTVGTFGGSLAHCDAASEWCLVARLLDAEISTASRERGVRTIAAENFFQSLFTTAMLPDEMLTAVALPLLDDQHHAGFVEFARRAGDFAIVSAAVLVRTVDGVIRTARVCLGGVSSVPFRSSAAEAVLLGQPWSEDGCAARVSAAAADAAATEVAPTGDMHGSEDFRRDLVRALVPRALAQAADSTRNRMRSR